MILYFIAGFISGAVGMLLLLGHIGKKLESAAANRKNEETIKHDGIDSL